MKIITLAMLPVFASANSTSSANGIQIQMQDSHFTEPQKVSNKMPRPYCMEQGELGQKVKFNTCTSANSSQKFSYSDNFVKSSSGLCLTRHSNYELYFVQYSTYLAKKLDTYVNFERCDSQSSPQKWDLVLSGDSYKLKELGGIVA